MLLIDAAKELEYVLVLYALGDHERARLAGERSHCHQNRPGAWLGGGADNDAAVELDELGAYLAQDLEARVACSDVVDRDLETLLAQPLQALDHPLGASTEALGDLDNDRLR